MKKELQKITQDLTDGLITNREAETLLLSLLSVTKRFSKIELKHIFSKVKEVTIKKDFKKELIKHFGEQEYLKKEDEKFFKKYAGKKVNVYEWAGDWWICEDDNYVLTSNCFVEDVW